MASPLNRFNLGEFNSGTYTPAIHDIEAITQSNPAIVTTVENHDYVVNQEVQFFIPPQWGMRQLNQLKGFVLAIPADDQFTVNIDTSLFDAFVIPSIPAFVVIDPAEVVGIGDANFGQFSPGGVVSLPQTIPGAYQNHRPI
ncbi:MAG: hypothetical protein ACM3ZS_08590 [Nitrososphaerota archaeon]